MMTLMMFGLAVPPADTDGADFSEWWLPRVEETHGQRTRQLVIARPVQSAGAWLVR